MAKPDPWSDRQGAGLRHEGGDWARIGPTPRPPRGIRGACEGGKSTRSPLGAFPAFLRDTEPSARGPPSSRCNVCMCRHASAYLGQGVGQAGQGAEGARHVGGTRERERDGRADAFTDRGVPDHRSSHLACVSLGGAPLRPRARRGLVHAPPTTPRSSATSPPPPCQKKKERQRSARAREATQDSESDARRRRPAHHAPPSSSSPWPPPSPRAPPSFTPRCPAAPPAPASTRTWPPSSATRPCCAWPPCPRRRGARCW